MYAVPPLNLNDMKNINATLKQNAMSRNDFSRTQQLGEVWVPGQEKDSLNKTITDYKTKKLANI